MVVTVSTDARDSTSMAFSTFSRSSRTRLKISLAVRAWFARSVSIELFSVTGRITRLQTKAFEVGGRQLRNMLRRRLADFGERLQGFNHHGRFVAFAAIRNRR